RLESLKQTEWSSYDNFEKLQIAKLQEVLKKTSTGSVYYRKLFANTGFHPDALSSLNALRQLPILEKETLHNHIDEIISLQVERKRLISGHTSGTTGTAIPLVYTQEALANEYAVVWRMRNRVGVELGMLNATFGGRLVVPVKQKNPPFWRINKPGKQVLFSLYHMTNENMKYYVEALQEYDFEYWQGYPSSIYLVAVYLDENGIKLRKPPRAIFTSSESLLAYQRELIEKAVGAPIYDRYGNSEFCASMVQCEAGNYHVDMEFGLIEVEKIEETDETYTGHLICTGFWNEALPLIRYRVGDVATFMKKPCPCGRESTPVKEIDGRIEDYVVTPDGKRIGRMDHVFKDMVNIKESQILQDEVSSITVKIVRRSEYTASDEKRLLREFRSRLGDEIEMHLDYVDEIPRLENGKFRAVISSIPQSKICSP
ncbi:MAG: phenylacetate--CoA ligase family protein, partial [Candidatus Poribacteria bacterium]